MLLSVPNGSQTKTLENMEISPEGSKMAFLGSEGYVHIADGRSKQWIGDLKMNCTSRAVAFLDEVTCITSGFDADLYIWDLRYSHRPRCVSRFHHEDGTPTSSLAAYVPPNLGNSSSPQSSTRGFYCMSDIYLGVGTMSGISSVFEGIVSNDPTSSSYYSFGDNMSPKPLKTVMNLTTKITASAFHPSGQIMAIASNEVRHYYHLSNFSYC
jgi:WD40 repeat protein